MYNYWFYYNIRWDRTPGCTTGQSLVTVFFGGGGSGAVGTVTTTSGVITGVIITVTNQGLGFFQSPVVSVSGSGSGANITETMAGTTIINGGSNYTSTPTLIFTGGNGIQASATPTINVGSLAVFIVSFAKTCTYTWNNL